MATIYKKSGKWLVQIRKSYHKPIYKSFISKYDAQILNLCVDEDSRRLVFGEKIMDLLIEDIKSRGLNEIYFEVRSSNKQAISLYKKKGFELIGVRHS